MRKSDTSKDTTNPPNARETLPLKPTSAIDIIKETNVLTTAKERKYEAFTDLTSSFLNHHRYKRADGESKIGSVVHGHVPVRYYSSLKSSASDSDCSDAKSKKTGVRDYASADETAFAARTITVGKKRGPSRSYTDEKSKNPDFRDEKTKNPDFKDKP